MPLMASQQKWLDWFAPVAVAWQAKTGYWAENSVASAALESGWGQASIKAGNNPFGITYSPKIHADWVWALTFEDITFAQFKGFSAEERATATREDLKPLPATWGGVMRVRMNRKFAKFESVEQALASKIGMIQTMKQYRFKEAKDWRQMAQFLQDGGYATSKDPVTKKPNYAAKLISIGSSREVTAAIARARAAISAHG